MSSDIFATRLVPLTKILITLTTRTNIFTVVNTNPEYTVTDFTDSVVSCFTLFKWIFVTVRMTSHSGDVNLHTSAVCLLVYNLGTLCSKTKLSPPCLALFPPGDPTANLSTHTFINFFDIDRSKLLRNRRGDIAQRSSRVNRPYYPARFVPLMNKNVLTLLICQLVQKYIRPINVCILFAY
jgi:hypothetical protein